MIRLVGRRLIIPQGDTGTFTIPMQGTMDDNDKALISIYDNLLHKTVLEKEMTADTSNSTLTYTFSSEDTITAADGTPIEPDDRGSRYSWDIVIQRNSLIDENEQLIHCDSIDSYYAAFSLPPCVIKRVTRNV